MCVCVCACARVYVRVWFNLIKCVRAHFDTIQRFIVCVRRSACVCVSVCHTIGRHENIRLPLALSARLEKIHGPNYIMTHISVSYKGTCSALYGITMWGATVSLDGPR